MILARLFDDPTLGLHYCVFISLGRTHILWNIYYDQIAYCNHIYIYIYIYIVFFRKVFRS